jgi:hypothetical protein
MDKKTKKGKEETIFIDSRVVREIIEAKKAVLKELAYR